MIATCAAQPSSPPVSAQRGASALVAAAQVAPPAEPGYKVISTVPLANAGFDAVDSAAPDRILGWSSFQHAGQPVYRFTLDHDVARAKAPSLRIDSVGSEVYGAIEQAVPAAALRGKTVRYSGWIKTRDAAGTGASLTLSVDGTGGMLGHDFMDGREVTGTRDWKSYAITMRVPAEAQQLRLGAMMQGPGAMWFDDAELAVVVLPKTSE